MKLVPSRPVRRLLAGLTPIVLVCAALPLLAPTCGTFTPGVKAFSRNSLIIPMDVCYQCTTDLDSSTAPTSCSVAGYVTPSGAPFEGGIACPGATDPGDVVKAYGLVYQLIRNGVAVYWIVEPTKAKLDAEDFHVSFGGPPAFLYDWADPTANTTPVPATTASGTSTVAYRGGPFVIDGSDFALASQIMQQYKGTFGVVNVHVANVAFQAPVARTMAGGWNAGGAIAPKLALLDIGSDGTGGAKNSEPVIRGYLTKSGLDFAGAGGTSAANAHGQIYDRLVMSDFLPTTAGDWTTSKLYQNGYQILWVPHWFAAGSCADVSGTNCAATQYSDTDVSAALRTIGAFVTVGKKDLFAECAGLGSFDGVTGNALYSPAGAISTAQSEATRFQSTTGMAINGATLGTPKYDNPTPSFASPLLQLGDFPFVARTGAIASYHPTISYAAADSTATPEVPRLVAGDGTSSIWDYFTVRPAHANHGTIVYLAGHSYSGQEGNYQIAGTRLVLNTLFNLGASCVSSGVSCSTGQLGVCGRGAMTCSGGQSVCERVTGPTTEICNGLDDDCNGLVDDLPAQSCYDGPAATRNVGLCREGVRSCTQLPDGSYGMSACQGQQLPVSEVCNALDDDCNGFVDDDPLASPVGSAQLSQSCYQGPAESLDPITGLPMGECRTGTRSCASGIWGACAGQVTPVPEACGDGGAGNGIDENCNGAVDETCGCSSGATQPCYGGPTGTAGVGPCKAGTQTCSGTAWGTCVGQVVPAAEVCANAIDDDCNGTTDDPAICNVCPATPQSCYTGPGGTVDVGVCKAGERVCYLGTYGACGGTGPDGAIYNPQVLPSQEVCDGKDNDCDGVADEGPPACAPQGPVPYSCVNGYCVPDYCNPSETAVIFGYSCDPATSKYVVANCGTIGQCAAGTQCTECTVSATCPAGWSCIDPCDVVTCGPGSTCGGGQCTGGSCYVEGCPGSGDICKNGGCTTDPCLNKLCPSGTFCRDGDCVQACTFVSCLEGQRCGADGFCETDPCAGVSCAAGKVCSGGACVTDPCRQMLCDPAQLCQDGVCVDNPCSYIDCPVGVCYRGQCFSSANPTGAGTVAPETDSGGCGCATGAPSPIALFLGLLAIPLARRRREPRRGAGLLAIALAAGLTATLAGCPKEETPAGPIDLMTDAANCGQLGNACGTGEICVDGFCGPGSAVAPYITSLSPTSAAKGTTAPVPVTINGARFQTGAMVRVTTPLATYEVPATGVAADHLTATLSVGSEPPGILYLRVLNPGDVRSNARPFYIVLESPNVSSIAPLTVEAGTVTTLHVTGTGLNATSQCHLSSASYSDTALPTVVATGGGLDCTLDTADIPPGNYQIWVRNEGNLNSATSSLRVNSSGSLTLASISPSSDVGGTGRIISLTATGTGFDSTCRVWFDSAPQGTLLVDSTTLFVAQLDLTPFGTGPHGVTVHCAATSNALTFTIGGGLPTLTTVSPQTAYQGETKVVTFSGTAFPTGTVAEIRQTGGTFAAFSSTSVVSMTEVTGTLILTPAASWPPGEYEVRLHFPDSTYSTTFPFRVLSNTATLLSVTPAGGPQGTAPASLSVIGTNFFTGITFHLVGTGVDRTVSATSFTPTTATTGSLSLASLDTGVYQFVAYNVGSGASNALSFSVTPGLPSITNISICTTAARTSCAVGSSTTQSSTLTYLRINGGNFAKPDSFGNGGSQVVAWNAGFLSDGVTPIIDPASPIQVKDLPGTTVTVIDYDTIDVTLDTRSVLATTSPYTIQVWNPGGDPPPQKSGTTTFTVSP